MTTTQQSTELDMATLRAEPAPHWLPTVVRGLRRQGILIAFVALFVVLSIASDAFLTKDNMLNLLEQNAPVLIVAVGGTLVLIAGGLDLSAGAVYALAGIVAAEVTNATDPVIGFLAGALAGSAVGAANGLVTTVARVNSLITTLAAGIIVRGIAVLITAGFVVSVSDGGFRTLGTDSLLGVKVTVWTALAFTLVCGFVLHKTPLGRYMFATGGNAEAARLSGVRVDFVRFTTFAISGLAAGVAGVLAASTIGTGQADVGLNLELTAIAAIVVGGTTITGGEGAVWRTFVGVFFLALIDNGLNLLGVDPTYQQIVQGAIIIAAVSLDAWARRLAR